MFRLVYFKLQTLQRIPLRSVLVYLFIRTSSRLRCGAYSHSKITTRTPLIQIATVFKESLYVYTSLPPSGTISFRRIWFVFALITCAILQARRHKIASIISPNFHQVILQHDQTKLAPIFMTSHNAGGQPASTRS